MAVLVSLAGRLASADQPTLSGQWSASAMRTSWAMGEWSAVCGPKPGASGAPSGTVTIVQQGGELRFIGAGRSYSTAQCWEQRPGLARVSHTGGTRGWRTVCKTPSSDPRQATVVTTISATDEYITFDETGQYQFALEGANCTASARRSRSFRLIQRAGEPPPSAPEPSTAPTAPAERPPAAEQPSPKPPPAPRDRGRCDQPGPPARLEVRPSRKLMRAGERFSFRTRVLDENGCPLRTPPVWRLADPRSPVKLLEPGKVRVEPDAPESEAVLTASLGGRTVRVVVEVASAERYEALLQQGRFDASGERGDAAVAVIASGSIGSRSTGAQDQAQSRKLVFAVVVGALTLLFGGLTVVVVARSRKRRASRQAQTPTETTPEAVETAPNAQPKVCPTCGKEYPPDAVFCSNDGNHLVAADQAERKRTPSGGICPVCGQGFDPGVRTCPTHGEALIPAALYAASREAEPAPTKKICPVCGDHFEGDAQFCGNDGATLVPIN
jgi:predicted nucleic acid-binding Zn ribbon protein